MPGHQPAIWDERREPRLDVMYRTRAVHLSGLERAITVVNVSAGGLMARGEGDWAAGDRISILLPVVGLVAAQVRWALGGRIGCQFARGFDAHKFHTMLQDMLRSK